MKLTKGRKKIILMIVLVSFVVLLFNSNTIFAAINNEYIGDQTIINPNDDSLDTAVSESSLLAMIAKLIYALGRLLEWILGAIFKMLTNSAIFPWADRIVFNAVPILDINFINPASNSFFHGEILVVMQNLYSTILALAVTFFGIAVMITAIKLVISTIASDKAKYKQAIIDWIVGLVMVFCIHYFISFIFYLNEQLVIVASKIVTSQLEQANDNLLQVQISGQLNEIIESTIETEATYGGRYVSDIIKENSNIALQYINLDTSEASRGLHSAINGYIPFWSIFDSDKTESLEEQHYNMGMMISWAADKNITVKELQNIKKNIKAMYDVENRSVVSQAISKEEFNYIFDRYSVAVKDEIKVSESTGYVSSINPLEVIYSKNNGKTYYCVAGVHKLSDTYGKIGYWEDHYQFYWTDFIDDLIKLKAASSTGTADGKGKVSLLSDLASYYKINAYDQEVGKYNQTGLRNTENVQIQNMIMYAVLVVQSLILFIAYVKRLFYVLLLAMMAPLVVVMDFFQKFSK